MKEKGEKEVISVNEPIAFIELAERLLAVLREPQVSEDSVCLAEAITPILDSLVDGNSGIREVVFGLSLLKVDLFSGKLKKSFPQRLNPFVIDQGESEKVWVPGAGWVPRGSEQAHSMIDAKHTIGSGS